MIVKLGVLLIFAVITVMVGILCRRAAADVKGFVLGGRNVGPWLSAFSFGTSYFSAVVFVGYAGQFGWKYGVAATWTGIANAFLGSYLAWRILGRRTRIMTQHLNSSTMPQFFGSRFDSPALKVFSSLIIFVFLIPYTASLYNGLSRLFAMAFSIDYAWCVIAMAALTAVYVIAGGYFATAVNDFIQGIIMLFGIVCVVWAVLRVNGGFSESLLKLAAVNDSGVSAAPGVFTSFFGPDPLNLLGVMILTSLGTWGLPQMVQKFYAIKSENDIHKGTVISTVFAMVVAGGCYFLGGFARLFADKVDPKVSGFDAIIPAMLEGLPTLLIALVVILVFAASMSTLSALVLTSASTLTLDFLHCSSGEKRQIVTMRFFVAVFVLISTALAVWQQKAGTSFIAQLMGVSWGTLAGAFLAPFMYGLYWKRTTAAACGLNFAIALLIMLANIFFRPYFPVILRSPINAGAFCMLLGLATVPLFSMLTPRPSKKKVDSVFSCYEHTVQVPVSVQMGTGDD